MVILSKENKRQLLIWAREAIKTHLETGDHLTISNVSSEFYEKRGCFVTLRLNTMLRGCIGTFDAAQPLLDNVLRMAVSAAVNDPRFPPLKKSELPQLKIEISILGEPVKVTSLGEIKIGRDGVLIRYQGRSGTYLPDVAVEQGWDVQTFVMHCAIEKAGLKPNEIAQAELYRYEVEKMKE